MKILAIDTTGWSCSVALWEDGRELSFMDEKMTRDQAAKLPQIVQSVLGNETPDEIVVNTGPGSFTGIRLGLGFARGLALGWQIPLRGVDGFTARHDALETAQDVLILIDAGRDDIFGRLYKGGVTHLPQSFRKEQIQGLLNEPNPPRIAGSGVDSFLEGMDYQYLESQFQGAQLIAYAFFKNPNLFTSPEPYYVREADVTRPSSVCHS